ncbi:preprotein translocase subunit SecE [Ureaplasma ceti]|uniref:Preprotein translocase subunit SecE n=1 Tax=Ureaplasma ceti TaxID=3119530 RepID=A0ABP9U5S5_9BACT
MKDKVKRRRILEERKNRHSKKVDEKQLKEEEIEANRQRQEYEERKLDFEALEILRKKIELAKEHNSELDKKFQTREHEFQDHKAFVEAFKENKAKRQLVIDKLELDYEQQKEAYNFKWEVGSFKFKRWFFGMGKEFSRVSWANKREVWEGFLIVVSIVIFLALVFLAIEAIFSVGLFHS